MLPLLHVLRACQLKGYSTHFSSVEMLNTVVSFVTSDFEHSLLGKEALCAHVCICCVCVYVCVCMRTLER